MNRLVYLVLLITFISSCKKDKNIIICGDDWEADIAGVWLKGDFHVHATGASNDTGGDSYPIDIKNKAIERGLDFVVLTDHSNSTGSDHTTTYEDPALFNQGPEFPYWDTAAAYTDANFIMINGNEISPVNPNNSVPTGHVGCIPQNLSNFDKNYVFTDRPKGSVNGAQTLQQATEAGCFKIINHPYAVTPWIAYDWTSFDYDALEIWNGTLGFDAYDQYGYNAWICDLLKGVNTLAIGGSDNHRVHTIPPGDVLNPPLAFPFTAVYATGFSWNEIMDAVKSGNTYIAEGESELILNDYTEGKCHANGENVYWIRLRGKADDNIENPKLILYNYLSCNDPRPSTTEFPELTTNVAYEKEILPNEEFDIALKVEGRVGVLNAVIKGETTHYGAISRAVVLK